MSSTRRTWLSFGLIALAALVIVIAPRGGQFVSLINNSLNAIFLTLIGISLVALYRSQRELLIELSDRDRGIVYGAVSVALLAFAARPRFQELSSGGDILMVLVFVACGAAIFWVWRETRRYSI